MLAPQWSPNGDAIVFGIGVFNAFFNGFHGLFLKPGDRAEGGAQIAMIKPDGSGFRELTRGPNNSGFPSMAPDGKRVRLPIVCARRRQGLRIMNLDTNAATSLTTGYDNFPLWSPRGDLIMFSRLASDDYEICTIKPDGTGCRRLTHTRGKTRTRHGRRTASTSCLRRSRMGFKDEMTYTDAPQPYGEIFVMRYDGTELPAADRQPVGGRHARLATRPPTHVVVRAALITRTKAEFFVRLRGFRVVVVASSAVLCAAAALLSAQGDVADPPLPRAAPASLGMSPAKLGEAGALLARCTSRRTGSRARSPPSRGTAGSHGSKPSASRTSLRTRR